MQSASPFGQLAPEKYLVNVTGKQKQRNTPPTAGPLLGMQGKNMDLEQSIQVLLTPGHHNNRRNDQKVFFISCVSQGRLDLAFKYISREPSPALYRTLLSCCTKANDFEGAKSVYMKQREAGFFPNEYVYSNLISAAGRANNVQDVLSCPYNLGGACAELTGGAKQE